MSWLIDSTHWVHSITMLIGQPSLEGSAGKGEKWFWSQKWLRSISQVRGGRRILTTHKLWAQVARGTPETNYYYYYYYYYNSLWMKVGVLRPNISRKYVLVYPFSTYRNSTNWTKSEQNTSKEVQRWLD